MSIPELDLNFHSYCSINIATASDTTIAEFNPFADGSYGSGATKKIVKTPDITYDSTTGRIIFGASGTYFIAFTAPTDCDAVSTGTAVAKIKLNGADVIVTPEMKIRRNMSPRAITLNSMFTVQAGDNITISIDGNHATTKTTVGTHIIAIKANGHFSGARYTVAADETTTASLYPMYDTDNEGGTVVSNTSGVTYSGADGGFTVSADRRFLLFSTWAFVVGGTVSDYFHKLRVGSTTIDELTAGMRTIQDPASHSFALVKSVTAADVVTVNFDQSGTAGFTALKSTSFSMLDISNDGTQPSAHLSLTLDSDSDAFSTTSGDKDVFKAGNTSSGFGTTNHTSAAGITYDSSDGTFTVAGAGDYLVVATIGLDSTTNSTDPTLKITVNDAAYYAASYGTRATADPISMPVCLVISLTAGQYLNFFVNNAGAVIDDGSSVSIVRLDDVGGSKDLFAESTPVVEIADDFTINSFNKDTSDRQYGRLVEQVPMKLGVRGPVSLRGRRVASTTAPSTEKGNKE